MDANYINTGIPEPEKFTVLIVDDNTDVVALIGMVFRAKEVTFQPYFTMSGEGALSLLRTLPFFNKMLVILLPWMKVWMEIP